MNNLFFDREWPEKYAVIDIEDYDKLKVILEIVERVKEAEIIGDFLWQLIRSEYLRVSNAKEYHGEEIKDIKLFKQEIENKMNHTELGKIDEFKINQLIEELDRLIEHLK